MQYWQCPQVFLDNKTHPYLKWMGREKKCVPFPQKTRFKCFYCHRTHFCSFTTLVSYNPECYDAMTSCKSLKSWTTSPSLVILCISLISSSSTLAASAPHWLRLCSRVSVSVWLADMFPCSPFEKAGDWLWEEKGVGYVTQRPSLTSQSFLFKMFLSGWSL